MKYQRAPGRRDEFCITSENAGARSLHHSQERSACPVKRPTPLFEIEDRVVARPLRRGAPIAVEASEDDATGVAGVARFGELLDRLGLIEVADHHHLRPIGPGGSSGGERYRLAVELQLSGGDCLSDVSLLFDEATGHPRDSHVLPSRANLLGFLAGADFGRARRAKAVDRDLLRRARAMGTGAHVDGRNTGPCSRRAPGCGSTNPRRGDSSAGWRAPGLATTLISSTRTRSGTPS